MKEKCCIVSKHMVKPDSSAAPVAFPERMGNVHFYVFFNNLVKVRLRHGIDAFKSRIEIHDGRKAEVSLGKIDIPDFSCKFMDVFEKISMNYLQRLESAGGKVNQYSLVKELCSLLFADSLFLTGKNDRVRNAEFVCKRQDITPQYHAIIPHILLLNAEPASG